MTSTSTTWRSPRRAGYAGNGLDVDTSGVGTGRVRGDRTSLAQVVRNLVDNAARHADASIAVAVREAGDRRRAGRRGRRSRDPRGPAGPGLRAVRAARRGARPGRRRERSRAGHRQGDRRRPRRDGHGLVRSAGWRPVRRTASCAADATPCQPERAFRRVQVGFSEVVAGWVHTQSATERPLRHEHRQAPQQARHPPHHRGRRSPRDRRRGLGIDRERRPPGQRARPRRHRRDRGSRRRQGRRRRVQRRPR